MQNKEAGQDAEYGDSCEQDWHDLLENAADLIQSVDSTGRFLYVNRIWKETLGYTDEDLKDLTLFDIISKSSMTCCTEAFEEVFMGHALNGLRSVFVAKDKREVFVEGDVNCRLSGDKVVATRGIFRVITPERQEEEEKKEVHIKFLQQLIDAIPNPVFYKDQRGVFLGGNTAFYQYIGLSPEEVVGKSVYDISPGDFARVYDAKDQELFSSPGVQRYEGRVRYVDGTDHDVIFIKATFNEEDGSVGGLIGTILDVTELRSKEAALEESEEKFSLTFRMNPEAVSITRVSDGCYIDINEGFSRLSGYTRDEILKKTSIDLDIWVDPERRAELTRRLSEDGIVTNMHARFRKKDGSLIDGLISAVLIPLGTGPHILSITRDVTELRKVEDALRESEARYRGIFNNINDAIIVNEIKEDGLPGRIIEANDLACRMLGVEKEALHTLDVSDFLARSGWNITKELIEILMEKGILKTEGGFLMPDGTEIAIEVDVHTIEHQHRPAHLGIFRDITGRKKLEDELRRSEETYRTIFENTGTAMLLLDEDTTILLANSEMEEISGYSRAEIEKKMKWTKFVDEKDLELMKEYHKKRRQDPESVPHNYEFTFKSREGRHVPVFLTISMIPGTDMSIASVQDITAQKEAIKALSESEEIFRGLTSAALDAIVMMDPEGRILIWNEAAERMFGYTADEVLGKNLHNLLAPARYRQEDMHDLAAFARTGKSPVIGRTIEMAMLRKNGKEFPMELSVSAVKGREGWNAIGIIRDITERKAVEDVIREREESLGLVVSGADLGTWDLDLSSRHVVVNDRWFTMIGYEPGEFDVNAVPFFSLIHPDDVEAVREAMGEVVSGKKSGYRVEFRIRAKDKSWVWVLSAAEVAERGPGGRPVRMAGIHQDITESKRIEEALRETNKKLAILSSITRHDILNQVQALLFSSEELEEQLSGDPDLKKLVGIVTRASGIIERQISFTRDYETLGVEAPEWQEVALVASDAAAGLLPQSVEAEIGCKGVEVYADGMLQKVFFNLMENSLRHGGGITRISVSCTGGAGMIIYEDNGKGIPEKMKERIFERGVGSNTGYGLFITREILGITGLSIRECGQEGKGARFEISVPAVNIREEENAGRR